MRLPLVAPVRRILLMKGIPREPNRLNPRSVGLARLCASSSAKLGGHACWSCGLTECEFLVLSQVVHVDVAIGLHPVFVGFDGERADEA